MQKRTESNIRDKRLVKMVKLQVKTETKRIAEMLNEMNPKLKALLAAGLIGTAGLGMQSCSNPSDPVYYPYTVEAPSTDNPGSGGVENGGETVEETEEQKWAKTPFGQLNVKKEDAAKIADSTTVVRIVPGITFANLRKIATDLKQMTTKQETGVYLYREEGFQNVLEIKDMEDSANLRNLIQYSQSNNHYYIPKSMEESFKSAIDAYNKARQSNQ